MRLRVALLSLAATAFLFDRYLPPSKSVHFWADFDGFHYPLFNYAHKAIREGRFPEWDHSVYSGMPFAGNIQAALFYPPNWLLFWLNRHHSGIRVKTMEWLAMLHLWLAFFLAWRWLRGHTERELPAVLGAGVFAFGGYPLAEMQHYGVTCSYAWYPLGLLALDEYAATRDWRRLWKLAAASALSLLSGYPGAWFAFSACMAVYGAATARWRGLAGAFGAVVFSGLLAAVQLGPALEAVPLKVHDPSYWPLDESTARFYVNYLIPNFSENGASNPVAPTPAEEYCYLGSPAVAGLVWLAVRRRWRQALPAFAVAGTALAILTNPLGLVSAIVLPLPVISEICHGWNFLALLTVAAAMAAAVGLDGAGAPTLSRRARAAIALLLVAWAVRQFVFGRQEMWLGVGWWSAAEAAVCALVFALGLAASRASRVAAAALLAAVLIEYQTYGVARRFNAKPGDQDEVFHKDARTGGAEMIGVDNAVYAEMQRHPNFRLGIIGIPHPTEIRHYPFATPQGFDPLLTRDYRALVQTFTPFETNRIFPLPVDNDAFLRLFGVRFVTTINHTAEREKLAKDPRFRLMEPARSFLNVFEYRDAQPAYHFEAGTAECLHWRPEYRAFEVESKGGGTFVLAEQRFPGWRARIDGTETAIVPAHIALQGVAVPAGKHRLEFEYRSLGLRMGAAISALAVLALAVAAVRSSDAK